MANGLPTKLCGWDQQQKGFDHWCGPNQARTCPTRESRRMHVPRNCMKKKVPALVVLILRPFRKWWTPCSGALEVIQAFAGARSGWGRMHFLGLADGNPYASASVCWPQGVGVSIPRISNDTGLDKRWCHVMPFAKLVLSRVYDGFMVYLFEVTCKTKGITLIQAEELYHPNPSFDGHSSHSGLSFVWMRAHQCHD